MLDIHGAVLGLRELAEGLQKTPNSQNMLLEVSTHSYVLTFLMVPQIFKQVDILSDKALKGYRNDLLLEASCQLIASTISEGALQARPDSPDKDVPKWKMILDLSLKHRNAVVQEAGARLFGTLSQLRNNEGDINR